MTALVGASGSGKTTLVRLIAEDVERTRCFAVTGNKHQRHRARPERRERGHGHSSHADADLGGAAAPRLENWDQPLQDDISGAQQALDFLEQSAGQLRNLKADLSARLASRQRTDGTLDARVRQFANSWRNRSEASGGTLDSQLNFSNDQTSTRFSVRGMNMGNLRVGGREVLAIALGGQSLRSVVLEPGLTTGNVTVSAVGTNHVRVSIAYTFVPALAAPSLRCMAAACHWACC